MGYVFNIHDGVRIKQGMIGKEIFPKMLFSYHRNHWVCELSNVIGRDPLERISGCREFMSCSPID